MSLPLSVSPEHLVIGDQSQFQLIRQESFADSADTNRYAVYLQSAVNVARLMGDNKEKLRAVIRDLVDIAGADGVLHENEVTMIKAAAIAYGLSADLRINVKTGRVELTLKDAN